MTPSTPHLRALREWMIQVALPFWIDAGFDSANARFRERLTFDGDPIDVPHRAMVQARQIFTFAQAARRGWIDPGDIPARAMARLVRDYAERTDGRTQFVYSLQAGGGVASGARDAYTHAFVLLASAALHGWAGDRAILALADEVTAYIEHDLTDAVHGGLFDQQPDAPPFKRQNPVMHLFEAYLALAEACPGRGYLERAGALAALFRQRLFDRERGALLEYYATDWSHHPDDALGRHFEPGHHFEWAWLLDRYAKASGDHAFIDHALFDSAAAYGRSASGILFDQVDAITRQPAGSFRLWPHTEAIKAALVRPDGGDLHFAEAMAGVLNERFVGRPFAAGWIDRFDEAGNPLVDHVPASSLYHLAMAAFEIEDRAALPQADERAQDNVQGAAAL